MGIGIVFEIIQFLLTHPMQGVTHTGYQPDRYFYSHTPHEVCE